MSYSKERSKTSSPSNTSTSSIFRFVSLFVILASLFNACEARLSKHNRINNNKSNQRLTNSLEDTDSNQGPRQVYFKPNELESDYESDELGNFDYSEELDIFRPKKKDDQLLTEKKNDALIQVRT